MAAKNHNERKQFCRRILCFVVALSFIATLLPIAGASANSSDTMACCAGKAGHCDSGIAPKKVLPPTSEPMCGLKAATMEDDGITIVAEPSRTESQHSHSRSSETSSSRPAAESDSLSQPCRMDCGACLASSTRLQKRERSLVQPIAPRNSAPNTQDKFEYRFVTFSLRDDWEQTSPRGPPTDLF